MVGEAVVPDALAADFARRKRHAGRSALARACGAAPGLRLHDAMAGWGTDGLLLASLGCRVHMSERVPRVHDVLVARLAAWPDPKPTCALEDARCRWRSGAAFDVIYLDPMFGPHPKTALPAKAMQTLAALADPPDENELAQAIGEARRVATVRVVVKRRASASAVGRPDWAVRGRSVRFDVYRA